MKKKITNKPNHIQAFITLSVGILLLCLTPFVWPISFALMTASCPKNEFGSCPFEINFPNSIHSVQIAVAWGLISIIIVGIGVYLRYRRIN